MCATGLCSRGTRCEQVDYIFTGSHSLQAAADGSITPVPCHSQNEKSWSGSCSKSMYRNMRFVWIDSGHEHQTGEEHGDSVCCMSMCACLSTYVLTPQGRLHHFLCRSVKMEELCYSKICTNMLGNPVLSVLSVEPNRNMDLLSYAPCHTDIWFIPPWADTLARIRHQCDTVTLCDAVTHRRTVTNCYHGGDLLTGGVTWQTLAWSLSSQHIHLQITLVHFVRVWKLEEHSNCDGDPLCTLLQMTIMI